MPLDLPTSLPFPAGESPFAAKGLVHKGLLERLDRDVPGGRTAVLERLEPAIEAFFRQRFLTGGWYDYLPLLLLTRARLAVRPPLHSDRRSDEEILRQDAIAHANADMRGVYRPLLRFTRPADVLGRGLTVLRQYVNFGNLTVETLERQHGVVTVHGWPAMGAPYFRAYSWPFLERLLTMAGAKHATL